MPLNPATLSKAYAPCVKKALHLHLQSLFFTQKAWLSQPQVLAQQ